MENPIKMDDLGGGTTIIGNIHMWKFQSVSCSDTIDVTHQHTADF